MPRLRLSALAELDIEDILFRSERSFGEAARLRYEALIETALRDVAADPHRIGVKARNELGRSLLTYHLFNSRNAARTSLGIVRRPRHILVFRLTVADFVDIGRVLHDAMDLREHLPDDLFSSLEEPDS